MKTRLRQRASLTLAGFSLLANVLAPSIALAQSQADRSGLDSPAGDDFYCAERKLGTWFYCEAPKKTPEVKPQEPERMTQAVATAQMKAIKDQLEGLKTLAIMDPTTENVSAYIAYQKEQLDRASTFADVWGRAIWQNPSLDYTLQRPINSLGKRAWSDQRRADKASTMANLSSRYGVFYFYSGSCGACEVFSPVLKSISDEYGLSVLAVSMDGGANTAFSDYVVDSGQYRRMGLQGSQVPALVLFDSVTKRPIPIGYGIMSADEVVQRIFALTSVEPGSDF